MRKKRFLDHKTVEDELDDLNLEKRLRISEFETLVTPAYIRRRRLVTDFEQLDFSLLYVSDFAHHFWALAPEILPQFLFHHLGLNELWTLQWVSRACRRAVQVYESQFFSKIKSIFEKNCWDLLEDRISYPCNCDECQWTWIRPRFWYVLRLVCTGDDTWFQGLDLLSRKRLPQSILKILLYQSETIK